MLVYSRVATQNVFRLCGRAGLSSAASPVTLNAPTEIDVTHFASFLHPSCIVSSLSPHPAAPEELLNFNNDWMGRFRGSSSTVLKPKTTQQVSQILKWCNEKRIGVVPQGGNTGLVGGSVPVTNELVLSLSNMNTVRSFDPISGVYLSRRCRLYTSVSNRLCCAP